MQLSVTCPRCESKYQLAAEMRGKRMRCPNAICRAVFEVRDDADPVVPKPPEPVKEAPPVEATKPEPVKPKPIPKPIEPQPVLDFPDDFPGDDEAAPEAPAPALATEAWKPEMETTSVRAGEAPQRAPMRESKTLPAPASAPRQRRLAALWVISAMLLGLGIVGGVSYWRVVGTIETNEAERFQKAEELYKKEEFAEASAALQKLQRDFPESASSKKYGFLAELSDVRQSVYQRETADETVKSLERVLQLASVYSGDPLLREREADLWKTLDFLAQELTELAKREKAPPLVPLARRAWAEAKKYPPPVGADPADRERKLVGEWARIEVLLAVHFERQHVVAMLEKHLDHLTAANIQEAWALAEKTKHQDDPEVRTLLKKLFEAHRDQIKFVAANADAKRPSLDEDALPSLRVTPSVKAGGGAKSAQPSVLALARGVLYALDPANGELRWARRLGIDTHLLPLRVPADELTPELVLALSSDQRSLSALIAATGQVLWRTPLAEACVGQPVRIGRLVLVPTLAGRIEQIEIAEGRPVGSYHVGQPLTLGGVRQPGTPLVYFPADEFCLYVIDVTKRSCTNILYTRHAAGSLPGLPGIVQGAKNDWLLWSQSEGPGRAVIKPYALPIEGAEQKPAEALEVRPGMSAAPWQQAGRLAIMTDAGFLLLWGIQQKGTRDPLLFPQFKHAPPVDDGKRKGRCQIVHADAENTWTLTWGRLQRIQSTFDASKGPGLVATWTQPDALGTLLHAAQARQDADGKTILYLTTQADEHPTCVCSAIAAGDGKLLWQRQLGVLPQQTPLLAGAQVVLPEALGLLRFDPSNLKLDQPWQTAGDWLLDDPWADISKVSLVRDSSYLQLTSARVGAKLNVRIGPVAGAEKPRVFDVALPARLQGTPALGDGFLLLPLANGILVRVNLADGSFVTGPDWRAIGAEEQSQGHVVLVSATEFIRTDGSTGLARIASTAGNKWDPRAEAKLSHRITTAPVLIPESKTDKARLCVADASDTLTLLDADGLTVRARWSMPGKITAGPFVRDGKLGCVVAKNWLVWLDPNNKEAFAWEYKFAADIVGEPHLIDGVLVVADVAGHFVALDPLSGRTLGTGMTMKANVAATAAPLPFGPGHAFVPLTDGTVVLLPLEKLRQ